VITVTFVARKLKCTLKPGIDTGNLFDDIVDSRHSEADFFSEPWMYRLKESSPYSGSMKM
jgi:hypothetical protein